MLALFLTIENEEERRTAEDIWERYRKHIKKIAWSVLKNEADAEDAVMDTVRDIIQNISRFVDLNETETVCLVTVYAKNAAFKISNKNKKTRDRVTELADDQEDASVNVEDFVVRREDTEKAARELTLQPEMSIHIFVLRYYYDWSIREIAFFFEMSEAAVKKRLLRTKQKLKKQMEEGK